jgi:hypothetical protein
MGRPPFLSRRRARRASAGRVGLTDVAVDLLRVSARQLDGHRCSSKPRLPRKSIFSVPLRRRRPGALMCCPGGTSQLAGERPRTFLVSS